MSFKPSSVSSNSMAPAPQHQPTLGVSKDPEGTCSICTEPFNNPITVQPCKHIFDSECIRKWVNVTGGGMENARKHCPLCRGILYIDTIVDELSLKRDIALTMMCAIKHVVWEDLSDGEQFGLVKTDLRILIGRPVSPWFRFGEIVYGPVGYLKDFVREEDDGVKVEASATLKIRQDGLGTASRLKREFMISYGVDQSVSRDQSIAAPGGLGRVVAELLELSQRPLRHQALLSSETVVPTNLEDCLKKGPYNHTETKVWISDGRQRCSELLLTVKRSGGRWENHGVYKVVRGIYEVSIIITLLESQLELTDDYSTPIDEELQHGEDILDTIQQFQGFIEWFNRPEVDGSDHNYLDDQVKMNFAGLDRRMTDLLAPAARLRCKYCNTGGLHKNGGCLFSDA